jgi:hypothetical protein
MREKALSSKTSPWRCFEASRGDREVAAEALESRDESVLGANGSFHQPSIRSKRRP